MTDHPPPGLRVDVRRIEMENHHTDFGIHLRTVVGSAELTFAPGLSRKKNMRHGR